jgi:5-methylcytosine-specific restriction enzyme B
VLRIKYLFYNRLGKTDLDVLENAPENATQSYLEVGSTREWFEELAGYPLPWDVRGQSDHATLALEGVPGQEAHFPARHLEIRVQHGQREGQVRLNRLRNDPIESLSDPVRANRPEPESAYIFLIRDQNDQLHARYLASLEQMPYAVRHRIEAQPKRGGLDLSVEGGIILDHPLLGRVLSVLLSRHNVILYGPPGTGKTWLMQRVQQAFERGVAPVLFDPEDVQAPFKTQQESVLPGREDRKSYFVTFHQSMSYEAFVAGIRPVPTGVGMEFRVEKGVFLEAAEHASGPGGASLLLIDEINRGSTAEILGELITVLEPDKRLGKDGAVLTETVGVKLPYTPESNLIDEAGRFRMPHHVYTLGSMNSVDRTVAPLDSALRRRFQIIEIPPDVELLRRRSQEIRGMLTVDDERQEWDSLREIAVDMLTRLNRLISVVRGPDSQLGHAYLWDVFLPEGSLQERRERLIAAFAHGILPQLREMFRDQPEELRAILGGAANEGLGRLFSFDDASDVLGGIDFDPPGWLRFHPPAESDQEAWLQILRTLAGRDPRGDTQATPAVEGEEVEQEAQAEEAE